MGTEPREREQNAGKRRDESACPGGAGIEHVAQTEEKRHEDGRCDWAGGFNEAAIRVAAKRDLFGEGGDSESDEIEKKQAKGARLRPEIDVQCSGDSHRHDGQNNEAPAERG